jgi:hypothetical protein
MRVWMATRIRYVAFNHKDHDIAPLAARRHRVLMRTCFPMLSGPDLK